MSEFTKQLIRDLKYPFGNRLLELFQDEYHYRALRNVLTLAKERVWLAQGQPIIDSDQEMYSEELDDITTSQASVKRVEHLLELLDEETQ